jgi:hypothetical protein
MAVGGPKLSKLNTKNVYPSGAFVAQWTGCISFTSGPSATPSPSSLDSTSALGVEGNGGVLAQSRNADILRKQKSLG